MDPGGSPTQPGMPKPQCPIREEVNQNSSENTQNQNREGRDMFRLQNEIHNLDRYFEALVRVRMNNCKDSLHELLQLQLHPDFFTMFLNILTNICNSSFGDSKTHILVEVCSSNFIPNLQCYLMNLPYMKPADKAKNNHYWSNPAPFWDNLLTLCETILLLSPSTALSKCHGLVEGAITFSLRELKACYNFTIGHVLNERLEKLKIEYALCAKRIEMEQGAEVQTMPLEGDSMLKCDVNLSCGHSCPVIYHMQGRAHDDIACPRKCNRVLCSLGHRCPQPCAEECSPCSALVEKQLRCGHAQMIPCHLEAEDSVRCTTLVEVTLPVCGHKTSKACSDDLADIPCPEACAYRLPCGHACVDRCHEAKHPEHDNYKCEKPCAKPMRGCTIALARTAVGDHRCKKKCYEACDECDVRVKKVIEGCGHEADVLCKDKARPEDCRSKCERTLPCGHMCALKCNEACVKNQCMELIPKVFMSPCVHLVQVPCYDYNAELELPLNAEAMLANCSAPCQESLACGHDCPGTCGACHQGRLHVPCTQLCRKILLCGHECEDPCDEVCPPCMKPCDVRCAHSRCNLLCGEVCSPCQEPCARACPHGQCTRTCSEPCSRAACDEPCQLERRCGHRCRGLCGEPCPDICNVCDPEHFPKDFLGHDFPDDAKLIKLQDCSHYMEVQALENLMNTCQEIITVRSCPYCRAPIISTSRYKDLVNATFRDDIDPIKRRVYGDAEDNKRRKHELFIRCGKMSEDYRKTAKGNKCWEILLNKIMILMINKSLKLSILELNMHSKTLDILEMLAEPYEEYQQGNLTEFTSQLIYTIATICDVLKTMQRKISVQQQRDIKQEIKRTCAIVQLSKIESSFIYDVQKTESPVKTATLRVEAAVFSWKSFDEENARLALEHLRTSVNMSGTVTKVERDLVVQALGFESRWYRCPNGHLYCFYQRYNQYFRPKDQGKCVDCGNRIGCDSYDQQVRSDNTHDEEIQSALLLKKKKTKNKQ